MSGKIIHDLNQLMPGYGENGVSILVDGNELRVEVRFDGEDGQEHRRSIKFRTVSFHAAAAFPGVSTVAGRYECDFRTGCVLEAEHSELSAQWTAYWARSGLKRHCSHFLMFWEAENKIIHVIAESSELI
ncbi:hypothetical protein [Rhizobium leucaenae]|uniref:hypothetical protein n=1 Tax=Rhizobium leucaenae TaxID=29450 RepID=UPI0012EA98F7|nr:hypothetical protein [Rhizobium leucaenae]MBB6305605.1 hypothetical protein [Rhizobium leucaenae]